MNAQDISAYKAYLWRCTDAQVRGVYEKEKEAGRDDAAALAEAEATSRGFSVDEENSPICIRPDGSRYR